MSSGLTLAIFNNWQGTFSPTAAAAQTLTLTLAQTVGASAFLSGNANVAYAGTIQVGSGSAATLSLGTAMTVATGQTLVISSGGTGGGATVFDLHGNNVAVGANTLNLGSAATLTIAATGGGQIQSSGGGTLGFLGCTITDNQFATTGFTAYSTLCVCLRVICHVNVRSIDR